MAEAKRSLVISIIAILTFFLGVSGTVLALIGLGAISQLSEIGVSLPNVGIYLYSMLIGLVLFPLLAIAGYNMWKMKKWAAKLAVVVYLFDSLTGPFVSLLTNTFDIGNILALLINILVLVGLASAWKDFL